MKKADMTSDDLRPEYHREDFGPMMRGKYAARLREASNIVVLDPEIAEVFPNAKAVNDALRGLLELAKARASHPAVSPLPCSDHAAIEAAHRRARQPRRRAIGDAGHAGPNAPDGRGAVRGVAGVSSCNRTLGDANRVPRGRCFPVTGY